MAKRPVPLYDFKAFGAAIKAARNEYGESRKKVSDELYISPRYLANIENKGQQPSLQVFYDLVTRYHISVDQFFFPNSNAEKSTGRRQLDALLDGMSDKGIRIVTATAREIDVYKRQVQSGAEGYTGIGGAGHEGRRCVLPAAQQPDGAPVSGGRFPDREGCLLYTSDFPQVAQ